ncbi:hypothetical protein [Arthrobacter sp. NPDC089319]|uniref:hypothetical protein n=1 Tax=Arthrobacter sp. NPDC089319 TaxID=3155915 RepID=UPI0034289EFE
MSASPSQFDQRYDTIYQRGGDAPEAARSVGLTAPGPAAGATPAARVAEQTQPAFRAPATELVGDSVAQSTGIAEVIPPDAAPQVRPEGTPAHRTINPFLVALWVLGLGLTAFGTWASVAPYLIEMEAEAVPSSPFGPPWYFLLSTVAPNVLLAGLATIAGVLTLHAVGWTRRRG